MVTETTGNQSEIPSKPPWERLWNEISTIGEKVIDNIKEIGTKATERARKPWEQDWGGSTKSPEIIAPEPFKALYLTETSVKKAAQFTPEEIKARDVEMRSVATIDELNKEIGRTKDPKIKRVLMAHLEQITKK